MRRSLVAGFILLAGCADDLPGPDQPADQLYFPRGVLHVEAGNRSILVVASTNFDLRYNSGRLTALNVDRLFQLTEGIEKNSVLFQPDFGGALINSLRIDSFAGELAYLAPDTGGGDEPGRLFVASRFRNLLTMFDVAPDGAIGCGTEGIPLDFRFECTRARSVSTQSEDPFALAVAPGVGLDNEVEDVIAVAHLRPTFTTDGIAIQNVSLARRTQLSERLQDEVAGEAPREALRTQSISSFGGVSGMVYVPPGTGEFGGDLGAFLTLERDRLPEVALTTFNLERTSDAFEVTRSARLQLDSATRALGSRALTLGPVETATTPPSRAYAALEFQETADSFNAAVAVIDLTGDVPRFKSALEVGDELGPPAVLDRGSKHFLYVPDLRLNRVYVLDASTDDLRLVSTITGAFEQRRGGESFVALGFSAPAHIAIIEQEGRTLAFVTNFLNSTLAVIDVGDPDPRRHRLIARFGRAIDAFGDLEGP